MRSINCSSLLILVKKCETETTLKNLNIDPKTSKKHNIGKQLLPTPKTPVNTRVSLRDSQGMSSTRFQNQTNLFRFNIVVSRMHTRFELSLATCYSVVFTIASLYFCPLVLIHHDPCSTLCSMCCMGTGTSFLANIGRDPKNRC